MKITKDEHAITYSMDASDLTETALEMINDYQPKNEQTKKATANYHDLNRSNFYLEDKRTESTRYFEKGVEQVELTKKLADIEAAMKDYIKDEDIRNFIAKYAHQNGFALRVFDPIQFKLIQNQFNLKNPTDPIYRVIINKDGSVNFIVGFDIKIISDTRNDMEIKYINSTSERDAIFRMEADYLISPNENVNEKVDFSLQSCKLILVDKETINNAITNNNGEAIISINRYAKPEVLEDAKRFQAEHKNETLLSSYLRNFGKALAYIILFPVAVITFPIWGPVTAAGILLYGLSKLTSKAFANDKDLHSIQALGSNRIEKSRNLSNKDSNKQHTALHDERITALNGSQEEPIPQAISSNSNSKIDKALKNQALLDIVDLFVVHFTRNLAKEKDLDGLGKQELLTELEAQLEKAGGNDLAAIFDKLEENKDMQDFFIKQMEKSAVPELFAALKRTLKIREEKEKHVVADIQNNSNEEPDFLKEGIEKPEQKEIISFKLLN